MFKRIDYDDANDDDANDDDANDDDEDDFGEKLRNTLTCIT